MDQPSTLCVAKRKKQSAHLLYRLTTKQQQEGENDTNITCISTGDAVIQWLADILIIILIRMICSFSFPSSS
jgi:hypothetical protein